MLKLKHLRSIAWSEEDTGADGRVDTLHSSARDEIMAHFFGLYKPWLSRAPPTVRVQHGSAALVDVSL